MIALIKNATLKDLVAAVPELLEHRAAMFGVKVKVEGFDPMDSWVFREWFLDKLLSKVLTYV